MNEQTGVTVVTGDDGVVAGAGEEADVADVGGNGEGGRTPIDLSVASQYATGLGLSIGAAIRQLVDLGFEIIKG